MVSIKHAYGDLVLFLTNTWLTKTRQAYDAKHLYEPDF